MMDNASRRGAMRRGAEIKNNGHRGGCGVEIGLISAATDFSRRFSRAILTQSEWTSAASATEAHIVPAPGKR